MAERRIVNGWIYERDASGSIRPVGRAPAPEKPGFKYEGDTAKADLEGKRLDNRKTAGEIAIEQEKLTLEKKKHGLDAQKVSQQIEQAGRDKALARAPMDALDAQLRRAWELYEKGPGSTPAWSPQSLADFNPYSEANSQFDAAAAGIGEIGRNAFRTPGQGSQSDKELQVFIEANQPKSSDTDAKIREKLGNLERRLGVQYQALGVPYKPKRIAPPRRKAAAPQGNTIDFEKWGR